MIDLGRPALYGEGVTLFTDHADPGLFHYLPAAPRLRHQPDGRPELALLKYRLDAEIHAALGAGLLALTVDLGVEEERLERLRRRAARQVETGTRVTLTPVAADGGQCELVLIDRSSRDEGEAGTSGLGLVERILGAATPALYGTNAATFQAVLSPEGVALVEGALTGGGLPVGVIYNLRTLGLRPALRAEIVARWREAYEFLEARVHGGRLLVATDIGPTMEELVQREVLEIRIDELVPPGERAAVYDRVLEHAQRYVLEELFRPSLGSAPPPDAREEGALATIGRAIKDLAGLFTINHTLRDIERSELKTFTYRLQAAQAEPLTLAPQGTFAVLLADGVEAEGLVIVVPPAASPEMRFDVATTCDLAAERIDHLEVVLRYGERDERILLDAASPRREVVFWFEPELGAAIAYHYEVHLDPDAVGLQGVLTSPPMTTEGRVVRLDPRELYDARVIRVIAQGVPFDRFPRVLVDLEVQEPRAGWSAAETLELSAEQPEATLRLRADRGSVVRLRSRIRYLEPDGGEVLLDWERVEPGFVVVGNPRPDIVDLLVLGSARFGTAIRRLIVELRPRDAPEQVATRVLTGEEPAASWSWQPVAGQGRDYEYRVTVHTVAGELREGSWLTGPPGKLIVGEGGSLREIELLFVGKSLAQLGLLALKVRFAYADPDTGLTAEEEILVEDTRSPLRWSYPVAHPDRQEYSYQLTLIHADGRLEEREPVRTANLLAIQPLV